MISISSLWFPYLISSCYWGCPFELSTPRLQMTSSGALRSPSVLSLLAALTNTEARPYSWPSSLADLASSNLRFVISKLCLRVWRTLFWVPRNAVASERSCSCSSSYLVMIVDSTVFQNLWVFTPHHQAQIELSRWDQDSSCHHFDRSSAPISVDYCLVISSLIWTPLPFL